MLVSGYSSTDVQPQLDLKTLPTNGYVIAHDQKACVVSRQRLPKHTVLGHPNLGATLERQEEHSSRGYCTLYATMILGHSIRAGPEVFFGFQKPKFPR